MQDHGGNALSGSHAYSNLSKKDFKLNYDPDNNKNNIFARKLNRDVPQQKDLFSANPLTKIM